MQIPALHITNPAENSQFESIYLPCGRAQDLQRLLDSAKATAFIVSSQWAGKLLTLQDLIRNIGVKKANKQLAYYLQLKKADTGHVAFIATDYSSIRRAINGVKKAFEWMRKYKKERILMISIPDDLFTQHYEGAVSKEPQTADEYPEPAIKEALTETEASVPRQEPFLEPDLDDDEITEDWIDNELQKQCEAIDGYDAKLNASEKKFVGNTAEAQRVRRLTLLAAMEKTTVLLLGESGTGKEVVARLIHQLGHLKNNRFISVNCGSIPANLLESELFGHERGAFSGAVAKKDGLWKTANSGTLFLDEIGDLRLDHQVKILRALDEKEIRPVGSIKPVKVNARVIAATNRDLFYMVQTDQFREDLYYRLCGLLIRTPSLQNHPEDIPVLAQHLWRRLDGQTTCSELPQDILNVLQGRAWIGNSRELMQVLAALKTNYGNLPGLGAKHLKATFRLLEQKADAALGPVTDKDIDLERALCLRHLKQVQQALHACHHLFAGLESNAQSALSDQRRPLMRLKMNIDELKKLCDAPGYRFYNRQVARHVVLMCGKLSDFFKQVSQNYNQSQTVFEILRSDIGSVLEEIEQEIERLIT